jgi:hypothetical protein
VLPAACLEVLALEVLASGIMTYAPQQVPDLLQTQDYARAIAAAGPGL